jgi:hypothetical protein
MFRTHLRQTVSVEMQLFNDLISDIALPVLVLQDAIFDDTATTKGT